MKEFWNRPRSEISSPPIRSRPQFENEAYANALGVDYDRVVRTWETLMFENWKPGPKMIVDVLHAWNIAEKEEKN